MNRIQCNENIENAIYLLREIEAFLSFNTNPSPEELQFMKETINKFLSYFQEIPRNIQAVEDFFEQHEQRKSNSL